MGPLGKVSRSLPGIFDGFLGNVILTEGFLKKQIPCVTVIAEDFGNGLRLPNTSVHGGNTIFRQACGYSARPPTFKVLTVNAPYNFSLFRDNVILEFGHAKRGGGRVPGKSHIAPAEQAGIDQLENDIERSLRHG